MKRKSTYGRYSKRARVGSSKRTYKSRRKSFARRKNVIPRTITSTGIGFPKKMMMTHKYQETVSLTIPFSVGMVRQFMSCNGMYDPNVSLGGHQPLYFDQMSALYDHYVVVGSKITVTFPPPADSNMNVGIYIDDDANNTFTSSDTVAEQTQATRKLLSPNATYPIRLTKKWSAKKYFGGSILANTELQGTSTTNPTEQSYYFIYCQSQTSPTAAYTYNLIVSIEYIAIWKELKEVASS